MDDIDKLEGAALDGAIVREVLGCKFFPLGHGWPVGAPYPRYYGSEGGGVLVRQERGALLFPFQPSRDLVAAEQAMRAALLRLGRKGYVVRIDTADGYSSEPEYQVRILRVGPGIEKVLAVAEHDNLALAACRAALKAVRTKGEADAKP